MLSFPSSCFLQRLLVSRLVFSLFLMTVHHRNLFREREGSCLPRELISWVFSFLSFPILVLSELAFLLIMILHLALSLLVFLSLPVSSSFSCRRLIFPYDSSPNQSLTTDLYFCILSLNPLLFLLPLDTDSFWMRMMFSRKLLNQKQSRKKSKSGWQVLSQGIQLLKREELKTNPSLELLQMQFVLESQSTSMCFSFSFFLVF